MAAAALDADLALAMRLQQEEMEQASQMMTAQPAFSPQRDRRMLKRRHETPTAPLATSLVDESYELIDPTPDIYQLFRDFDKHFFWGKLGGVELKWSPQMTRCAGVCSFSPASGLCSVRLSKPLLTLRPRRDLVETLLHEMIHALLFVTRNNDNREEHGPEFHRHMRRINGIAGTNITVYHSFHDECASLLTHWWRCSGACRKRPPYFGFVKRSRNRAPGPNDFWWGGHRASCGGNFVKVREPEGYGKKKPKKEAGAVTVNGQRDIRTFVATGLPKPLNQPNRKHKSPAVTTGAPKRKPVVSNGAGRPSGTRPTASGGPLPSGNATGLALSRPVIGSQGRPTGSNLVGSVSNADRGQVVNGIRNNVHGFQSSAAAGTGGARPRGGTSLGNHSSTVLVPPRAGRDSHGATQESARENTPFQGRGRTLGGASSVPWYKRDPPSSAAATRSHSPPRQQAPPASGGTRPPPTGIFGTSVGSAPKSFSISGGVTAGPPATPADMVPCPVCNKPVPLQTVNDHVDRCLLSVCEETERALAVKSEQTPSAESEGRSRPPVVKTEPSWPRHMAGGYGAGIGQDKETGSVQASTSVKRESVWDDDEEDEEMLAEAADLLEASLVEDDAAAPAGNGPTAVSCNPDSAGAGCVGPEAGATASARKRTVSTSYDELLCTSGAGHGGSSYTESGATADAGGLRLNRVSATYGENSEEPIVIEDSDEEEDYVSLRASLSDRIRDFIKIEDSDDELFDGLE